jgi:hypothetical protein
VQEHTLAHTYTFSDRSDLTRRLNLAKSWLQECMSKHSKCCQENLKWLPTRLLRIHGSGASRVKLLLTKPASANENHGPYLTLSHCWGGVRFLTLTTNTLSQLLEGIDTSELPKTFQDAVKTTLLLGFEYIWIDSLCIMQDSIEDWTVESACMGDIYSNGVCNLAATGSPDGNGGLWVDPQHSFNLKCLADKSSLPPDSDDSNESYLSWHTHSRLLEGANLLLDGPLLKRGWVIQERILALRTLHFGPNQLFWECRHYQACETYPGGLPRTMYGKQSKLVRSEILRKIFGPGSRDIPLSLDEINHCWDFTVSGFSRCDLTNSEDKLVASSGLARKIHEKHPQFNFVAA